MNLCTVCGHPAKANPKIKNKFNKTCGSPECLGTLHSEAGRRGYKASPWRNGFGMDKR